MYKKGAKRKVHKRVCRRVAGGCAGGCTSMYYVYMYRTLLTIYTSTAQAVTTKSLYLNLVDFIHVKPVDYAIEKQRRANTIDIKK